MAEVPGRVRGAGFGVSQRDYFDHSTRSRERDNEILVLRGMVETLTQKLKSMEERMNEVESQKLVNHATPAPIPSAKGSYTQAYVPLPEVIVLIYVVWAVNYFTHQFKELIFSLFMFSLGHLPSSTCIVNP